MSENDKKISLELKPVIYAHHHGYRVVAKAHNISQAIVDALVASNHHLYFTNRKLDEQVQPLKFRFFSLTIEVGGQKEKCYVLARLEPRQDVVTHRGLVSATQFYVIDGPNLKIFEDELQANAALLMAKIPFLSFNLDKLGRNEEIKLPPTRLELDAGVADRELLQLPANTILPRLYALFTAEAFEAMEKRQKIFVCSEQFNDPIAIFNLYCRTFFTAHLEYYRRNIAFSTGELTTEIADYDWVFLHAKAGEKKGPNAKIISLEQAVTEPKALWYLKEEKLPEYYRLLSARIATPSYAAIEKLRSYCDFLLSRNEAVDINNFMGQTARLLNFIEALNRAALGNDFLNVLARFKITARTLEHLSADDETKEILLKLENRVWLGKENFLCAVKRAIGHEQTEKWRETLLTGSVMLEWVDVKNQRHRAEAWRDLFAVLYKVFSDSTLPPDVLEPFVQLAIDWLEFLIKSRTTWTGLTTLINEAIKDFAPGSSDLKEKIFRRMLAEKAGLASVPNEKEIEQPGFIFGLWSDWLVACTRENPVPIDGQMIYEKIWQQQIREIMARVNSYQYVESTFSKPLLGLCHQLNDWYYEKKRTKELFYEMWHAIENKQLEATARLLFLEFYDEHELSPSDYKSIFENHPVRLEAFIDRIMRVLMETRYYSLETDYRHHETLAFKFVLRLSALAAQPKRFEPESLCKAIQSQVRDNFLFTGKYSALRVRQHLRFWENVEEAVATGVGEFRRHLIFAHEIPIQAELLKNLNLIENRDYRQLRADDYLVTLDTTQFTEKFDKLEPEARKAFYDNLCGFIDATKNIPELQLAILPALWSYLRRAPKGNDPDVDRCFEKMMQFVANNVPNLELGLPALCREIKSIPCVWKSLKLKFIENERGVFIEKSDHENYLLQLAAATQDRPERIAFLLKFLADRMEHKQVAKLIDDVIFKHYLPYVTDLLRRRTWEMVFKQIFKE